MNIATLMVHVDGSREALRRVVAASDLAERFHAKLIGIAGSAPEPPPVAAPMAMGIPAGGYAVLERDRTEAELKHAERMFHSVTGPRALETAWVSAVAYPTDLVIEQCRRADLVIVGRDELRSPGRSADPGHILIKAGRPILLVPRGVGAPALDSVVIAWKNTREARRAITDALPFLHKARSVAILDIQEKAEGLQVSSGVEDVVEHLRSHHIEAHAFSEPATPPTIAAQICAFAKERKADLIIMGGYGHVRVQEWIFGGVTHDMLRTCPICCLMSH